jgi:hypothetical protein
MSGDVFGNGMLLSRHIKLLAAFNHAHVFLDPDPDPETSLAERMRLFELPRSTWSDYDASLISEGGGVYPRTAKSVPDQRNSKSTGRPALERWDRRLCQGVQRDAHRRRRQSQRRGQTRRTAPELSDCWRGRQPGVHAARPDRVRARGRPN